MTLSGYVVQADSLEAPSQLVSVPSLPNTGGQLSVVEEAGQMKAVLSNVTGEIVGVTGQFKSISNTGKAVAFTIDAQGQYVAYLDRTSFSNEDQAFTLALVVNLVDGSSHGMSDYHFTWLKETETQQSSGDVNTSETSATAQTVDSTSSTSTNDTNKTSDSSSTTTSSSTEVGSTTLTEGSTNPSVEATSSNDSLAKKVANIVSGGPYQAEPSIVQSSSTIGTQLRSASLKRVASSTRTPSQTATQSNTTSSSTESTVTKVTQKDQLLEIKYTRPINNGEVIKFAVWSEKNSQDDIIWYNADQTGAAYADLRKHRDYGKYLIHTYANRNGKMVYLDADTIEINPSGTVTVSNINQNTGSFDVTISNIDAPRGLSKVYVPTWTDTKGQDDIKWHEASRQTDGSYKVTVNKTQHKNESGKYNVHVYYQGLDGSMTGIGATSVELKELKPTGTVTVKNVDSNKGSFDVIVSDINAPKGLSKVYVPTWTEANGQDEIKWYEASRQTDGSYKVTVNKTQHKNESGKYNVHVYYQGLDGSMTGIGATSVELKELKPTGTVTVKNVDPNNGGFDVIVSNLNVPRGLSKVYVPTWTEANGQDEIQWYEASRQTDGSYKVTVNKSLHKNEIGKYNVHVYVKESTGKLTYIGNTVAELPKEQATNSGTSNITSGTISISNVNEKTGSFDVRVSNVKAPKGLSAVLIPTWTESNGQDDIVWHVANRQADGSYLYTVKKSEHKYGSGLYNVHVYYRGADGSLTVVGGTSVELPSSRSYTIYIDPGHGGVDPGATYGGIQEKYLAMSVANKLKSNLIQMGYQVLMTRTGDYNVDFKTERSQMANQSNADLFISLHFNATGLGTTRTSGIETYWYQYDPEYQPKINKDKHNDPIRLAESEILAKQVQSSLINETGAVNRGVRRETFAVLRETDIPAVLVELGFMDNPTELQTIKQDAYHAKLAKALAKGIDNWYGAVGGK
ncbi:hypothetical protein HO921_00240 [Streptococcus suis]|nr:hypothetical protein [Streptococcus suis]